jgi:hypothetical protein
MVSRGQPTELLWEPSEFQLIKSRSRYGKADSLEADSSKVAPQDATADMPWELKDEDGVGWTTNSEFDVWTWRIWNVLSLVQRTAHDCLLEVFSDRP